VMRYTTLAVAHTSGHMNITNGLDYRISIEIASSVSAIDCRVNAQG
jgi:hypothetical protein